MPGVAVLVGKNLLRPKRSILDRLEASPAAMAMPEAAMNKHNFATGGENQVGLARQSLVVKKVSIAQRIEQPSNDQFWLRVLRPYAAH